MDTADPSQELIGLNQLFVFLGVADQGSVRRSAETLYRASSAVSRSIQQLERLLEVSLFERRGQGMLLTSAGERVQQRGLRIAADLEWVRADAVSQAQASSAVAPVSALFHTRRLQLASMLYDVRHITTVALQTGLTQPAVSSAIAKLEASLGKALFYRSARGLIPTESAEKWMLAFKRVLAELRAIRADVGALKGVLEGEVTVGCLPMARSNILPVAITKLLAQHPALRIKTLESPYGELCAGLLSGDVDFIVGALRPLRDASLTTAPLLTENLVAIARSGHPLAEREDLTLKDLLAYPWVMSRSFTPLRSTMDSYFTRRGLKPPHPSVETADLAMLRGLLIHSDMVTILSRHQLSYEIETGGLRVFPVILSDFERVIGVTTRSASQLTPGAQRLLAEIQAVCDRLSGQKESGLINRFEQR
ncbi:MAG: LysR family transcriptional regulator [Pigmentiphaga sp.]